MGAILNAFPSRQGHFLLESGYHTDLWLTLDALFVSPRDVAPMISDLATRLRAHGPEAVCGPLLGGAFLAQAIAWVLDIDFYFAEPTGGIPRSGLFNAQYRVPEMLHRSLSAKRVAVVDDVISAGSSVRATVAAIDAVGAKVIAVGTILLLGASACEHFASVGIPLEALGKRDFTLWEPSACPLCRSGAPLDRKS